LAMSAGLRVPIPGLLSPVYLSGIIHSFLKRMAGRRRGEGKWGNRYQVHFSIFDFRLGLFSVFSEALRENSLVPVLASRRGRLCFLTQSHGAAEPQPKSIILAQRR